MLDQVIQNFLDEQKSEWLNKKIKKDTVDASRLEIEQEAENDFLLSAWINKMLDIAKNYYCTHPAKFTHPTPLSKRTKYKAKDLNIVATFGFNPNGFLQSGNACADIDLTGYPDNGDSTSLFKFLKLKLKNGLTVAQNLESNSEYIQTQLNNNFVDYQSVSDTFAPAITDTVEAQRYTSGRLKQVYFPFEDGYHLLSIVLPSGLMFTLKQHIDTLHSSETTKKSKESRKKGILDEPFAEVFNLTYIGFGGSNKQNVSVLNNQNGGVAYLLPSMPPTLDKRRRNPPRDSFFGRYSNPKRYAEVFETFHNGLLGDHNNIHVRNKIKRLIKEAFYQLIDDSWTIRYLPAGWSDSEHYHALPKSQKIWLDQRYREQRKMEEGWLDEIKQGMTRWFTTSYKTLLNNKALHMADIEFINIKALLDDCDGGLR